jgi:release factor glutamine methyltransferase
VSVEGTTRGRAWRAAAGRLRQAGLATPELDARLLVAAAFETQPEALILAPDEPVTAAQAALAEALLARRLAGEPVDRILGRREFWGLSFTLGPATLSPRPDTETLVAAALEAKAEPRAPLTILDLGTGTGAILVALLVERPCAFGIGVDASAEAAVIARRNAARHGVSERAAFLAADWDAALAGRFDLIVSNPPYIPTKDLAGLAREVACHDPRLALDGGADGLAAYRRVVPAAARLLAPDGVAVLELGAGQEAAVCNLAMQQGLRPEGPAHADLGGIARALVLRRGAARAVPQKKRPGRAGP